MPNKKTSKTIDGYRIQPMLPMHIGLFGAVCTEADFTTHTLKVAGPSTEGKTTTAQYELTPCVETMVTLGLLERPYTLVLSIEQALEADIIERVEESQAGCRCEVCGCRNDDPAGIHWRQTYPVWRKDGRVVDVTIPQDREE